MISKEVRIKEKYVFNYLFKCQFCNDNCQLQASKAERQKRSPTYKDLDFMEHHPEGILMEADTYNALVKTIQRDCRVLESFKIMDYSLLLGIHNLDQAHREKLVSVYLSCIRKNLLVIFFLVLCA